MAWLFGIARNVVASEYRRGAREQDAASRLSGRDLADDEDLAALAARIDAESAARSLYTAIAGLPPSERAVLELVAVDGLSVAEAAHALSINQVAARVRLHRARRTLERSLGAPSHSVSELPEVWS